MTGLVLGIDSANATFAACLLRPDGRLPRNVFPTTSKGFELLTGWLTQHRADRVHACLEATGR